MSEIPLGFDPLLWHPSIMIRFLDSSFFIYRVTIYVRYHVKKILLLALLHATIRPRKSTRPTKCALRVGNEININSVNNNN